MSSPEPVIPDPLPPLPPSSLVLASLSNVCQPLERSSETAQIGLDFCKAYSATATGNSVDFFTESQFVDLFYPVSSGYFYVNPVNKKNPAIVLSDQTYTTPQGKNVFSLYQVVLSEYLDGQQNLNSISHAKLMQLQKECLACTSLSDLRGEVNSLNWSEVVLALTQNRVIAPDNTNPNASAKVDFKIIFNFHSNALDFDLDIIFNYRVDIPKYVVVNAAALGIHS
jgi:hypothetical protein